MSPCAGSPISAVAALVIALAVALVPESVAAAAKLSLVGRDGAGAASESASAIEPVPLAMLSTAMY